jgi:hypothetical protein
MSTREAKDDDRELGREGERYRRAALEALGQLDWCVEYLYRLRRADIARSLARNRKEIIRRAGF